MADLRAAEEVTGTAAHRLAAALATASTGGLLLPSDATILTALPIPIYLVDGLGRLTFCNEALSQFWDAPLLVGRSILEQWPGRCSANPGVGSADPDLISPEPPIATALRTGKQVQPASCEGVRADGTPIVFRSSPTLLRDAAGEPIGAIDVLVDLSAQRTAEQELRESEEHYRNAVELSPQMPWTADSDGVILHFNERWCRFTGQSHEEAVHNAWHTVTNPADLSLVRQAMQISQESGEPFDARFRVKTHDGSERWVRARASARHDAFGAIVRWYGQTEDIHEGVMAEQELAQAEERYRYAGLATRDVFWDHDLLADSIRWSDGLQETFGYRVEDNLTLGSFWIEKIHPADRERVVTSLKEAIERGERRWTAEYRFKRADGSFAHVLDCGSLLRSETGAVVRAIGAMLDFTDRKRTEAELQLSEERLRLATAAAGLGISDFAVADGREHWSKQLRDILGIAEGTPSGVETFLKLVHPDDLPAALEQRRRTQSGDFSHEFCAVRRIIRPSDGELRWIATQGHLLRNQVGRVNRVIITVRDITSEKLAQDQAIWAATHDALTGLPNKAHFQNALNDLVGASSEDMSSSLLLIDLDNFKHVNDTLGHQAGDTLLVDVASRLRASVPANAMVARFGGDEFAVILPGSQCTAAVAVGRTILAALLQPCIVDARSVDVRASVGVASCPGHGADASTLLQAADIALYAAKAAGRSTVVAYKSEMRAGLQQQVSTLRQAREVLAADVIIPFYQPKVRLDLMTIAGAEALFRWCHPRMGVQGAQTMAAAFDDPELSPRIGAAMLRGVLSDLRSWLSAGAVPAPIAINASPVEIGQSGYADRTLETLYSFGIPPRLLEVEITETALIGVGAERVLRELEQLRAAGIGVALDDFGTGFSSLSHLVRFPVNVIKVDRSFVARLFDARADRAVVEAVIRLSNDLGLTTVAEGVETAAQAELLRGLGCTIGQGFLFSPAVPAAELEWDAAFGIPNKIM